MNLIWSCLVKPPLHKRLINFQGRKNLINIQWLKTFMLIHVENKGDIIQYVLISDMPPHAKRESGKKYIRNSEHLRAGGFAGVLWAPPLLPPSRGSRGRSPQKISRFWSLRYPWLSDFECILKTKYKNEGNINVSPLETFVNLVSEEP